MCLHHVKYFVIFYFYKFCQDENAVTRPVCSFVKPLRAGRLLDSARHAARFVSLMHHKKQESVGGGNKLEQWTTVHGFLCRNRGVCIHITDSFIHII